jgi:hypothetical protein
MLLAIEPIILVGKDGESSLGEDTLACLRSLSSCDSARILAQEGFSYRGVYATQS